MSTYDVNFRILKLRNELNGLGLSKNALDQTLYNWVQFNNKIANYSLKFGGLTLIKKLELPQQAPVFKNLSIALKWETPTALYSADSAQDVNIYILSDSSNFGIIPTNKILIIPPKRDYHFYSLTEAVTVDEENIEEGFLQVVDFINGIKDDLLIPYNMTNLLPSKVQTEVSLRKHYYENGLPLVDFNKMCEYSKEQRDEIVNKWCELTLHSTFEKAFPNVYSYYNDIKNYKYENPMYGRIVDVAEHKDNGDRYYIIALPERKKLGLEKIVIEGVKNLKLTSGKITSKSEYWPYIDVGRYLYYRVPEIVINRIKGDSPGDRAIRTYYYHNDYYRTGTRDPLSEIWGMFIDENPLLPQNPIPLQNHLNDDHRRVQEQNFVTLLDNRQVKRLVKQHEQIQDRLKKEEKLEKLLKTKWEHKFEILNEDPSASIQLDDIIFTGKRAIFRPPNVDDPEQPIECSAIKVTDVLRSLLSKHSPDQISFLMYLENLSAHIIKKVVEEGKTNNVTGVIGNISYKLHFTETETKTGSCMRRYFINGYRVNKDEMAQILDAGLCFRSTPEFNSWLKTVSRYSLRIHGLIQRGLEASVTDSLAFDNNKKFNIKLTLERHGSRNYIKNETDLFQIHDINRLETIQRARQMDHIISILTDPKISDIGYEHVTKILKDARKYYEDAIEKSQALLNKTIEKYGVVKDTKNGMNGYVVQGKLRSYFIEHSSNATVYSLPKMRPLCIVEKTGHGRDPNDQVGMDKIYNRIMMLRNDHLVLDKVHTLNF